VRFSSSDGCERVELYEPSSEHSQLIHFKIAPKIAATIASVNGPLVCFQTILHEFDRYRVIA
jgi:hypothetical protein